MSVIGVGSRLGGSFHSLSSLNPAGSTHTSELKPGQSSTVMIPCQTEVEKLNKKGVRGDKKQRKAA